MLGLCLFLLALWLACEIVGRDFAGSAPDDPYGLDRWRADEGEPEP